MVSLKAVVEDFALIKGIRLAEKEMKLVAVKRFNLKMKYNRYVYHDGQKGSHSHVAISMIVSHSFSPLTGSFRIWFISSLRSVSNLSSSLIKPLWSSKDDLTGSFRLWFISSLRTVSNLRSSLSIKLLWSVSNLNSSLPLKPLRSSADDNSMELIGSSRRIPSWSPRRILRWCLKMVLT